MPKWNISMALPHEVNVKKLSTWRCSLNQNAMLFSSLNKHAHSVHKHILQKSPWSRNRIITQLPGCQSPVPSLWVGLTAPVSVLVFFLTPWPVCNQNKCGWQWLCVWLSASLFSWLFDRLEDRGLTGWAETMHLRSVWLAGISLLGLQWTEWMGPLVLREKDLAVTLSVGSVTVRAGGGLSDSSLSAHNS